MGGIESIQSYEVSERGVIKLHLKGTLSIGGGLGQAVIAAEICVPDFEP